MNRLKELRQEKKLSQKELADYLGVNEKTISRWENGESTIKSDKAQALADYFGVSVGYLLGYSEKVNAKAKLLDIIISEGYILQSTLEKCIAKLKETDQLEIKKEYCERKRGKNQ